MTTELVLLLGLYAFILLGAFLGDRGPQSTFFKSAPRLAALIERDVAVSRQFRRGTTGAPTIIWSDPKDGN